MSDWEKDVWKKVYFTVGRKAIFQYTLEKSEAQDTTFYNSLGEIHSTQLKTPKRGKVVSAADEQLTTSSKDTTISSSPQNDLKRAKTLDTRKKSKEAIVASPRGRSSFSRRRDTMFQFTVFDQDKISDCGFDSNAEDQEKEPYFMKLFAKGKQEVG